MQCNGQQIIIEISPGKWVELFAIAPGRSTAVLNPITGPEGASQTPANEVLAKRGLCTLPKESEVTEQPSETSQANDSNPLEERPFADRLPGLRARETSEEPQNNAPLIEVPDIYNREIPTEPATMGQGDWIFLGLLAASTIGFVCWLIEKKAENDFKREFARREAAGDFDHLEEEGIPEEEEAEEEDDDDLDPDISTQPQPVMRVWEGDRISEPLPWSADGHIGGRGPGRASNDLSSVGSAFEPENERSRVSGVEPRVELKSELHERSRVSGKPKNQLPKKVLERLEGIKRSISEPPERSSVSEIELEGELFEPSSEPTEPSFSSDKPEMKFSLPQGKHNFDEILDDDEAYESARKCVITFFSQGVMNLEHITWAVFGLHKGGSKRYQLASNQIYRWRNEDRKEDLDD